MTEVSRELQEKYDSHYSDDTEDWRMTGAIAKAENIKEVAEGLSLRSVIEVGAGDGNILSLLSKAGFAAELVAAEISDSAIAQIEKKGIEGLKSVVKFDGYSLPFEDDRFDLAICSHVIEHVEFPRKLLREIKRISRKQVFEVPIDFSFRVDSRFDHFSSYGHINIYTPALFNYLLLSEGFTLLKHRNAMHSRAVVNFLYKKASIGYLKTMTKRLVWNLLPFLKRIKPNTYTVLTE